MTTGTELLFITKTVTIIEIFLHKAIRYDIIESL